MGIDEAGGSTGFWSSVADAPRLAVWLDESAAILVSALRNAPASLSGLVADGDPRVVRLLDWLVADSCDRPRG